MSRRKKRVGRRRRRRRTQPRSSFLTWLLVGSLALLVVGGLLLWAEKRPPSTAPGGEEHTALGEEEMPYPEVPRISIEEAKARLEAGTAVVLDVRSAEEYARAHIAGARSLPRDELDERYKELSPEWEIITYCT